MSTQTIVLLLGALSPFIAAAVTVFTNKRLNSANADKIGAEREDVLAEAQRKAQETALESASAAYRGVKEQCDECVARLADMRRELNKERRSNDALLDAVIEIVPLLDASDERTRMLRAAVRTARHTRYDYNN